MAMDEPLGFPRGLCGLQAPTSQLVGFLGQF